MSKEVVSTITDSNNCREKKRNGASFHHSLLPVELLEYRFSLFCLSPLSPRRLFYLVRAGVYTRNVINEHTRELSRTTEEGGGEEARKRKRVKKTKDVQNEERGSTRAKIYYDARGREITVEEKRGKRESRWMRGKGEADSDRASERAQGMERGSVQRR